MVGRTPDPWTMKWQEFRARGITFEYLSLNNTESRIQYFDGFR
jgi:hypothetical protein